MRESVTFRTPLLAFDELVAWSEGAADVGTLRSRLREVVTRPVVREALFVASPDLDEGLQHWLERPDSEAGIKVERALVRYFARMTGRCTPFGLFSGVSWAEVGDATRLVLGDRSTVRRHTRLDNDYLFALGNELAATPEVRAKLVLRPSSGLYQAAGRLRYAEAHAHGQGRTYHLVGVEPSPPLIATLERAREGARKDELVDALCSDEPDIERADAEAFVDELVESQLLVHDLSPAVTGSEPLRDMIATLHANGAAPETTARLQTVASTLADIDEAGLGVDATRYRAVLDMLPKPTSRLFQVDMIKPAPAATLGRAVLREIERGLEILARLSPPRDPLHDFRRRFVARYGDREVSLVEALDEEVGIGFAAATMAVGASPLLEGLDFPTPSVDAAPRWGKLEAFMLRRLHEVVARREHELVLTPADLDAIAVEPSAQLPDALSAMATVVARDHDELAKGRFSVLLHGAFGPSGARIVGRFCHAAPEIAAQVREHVQAEAALRPDAIFAEIVHLPEGRTGNIVCRPVLRDYEIAYLGRSGADPQRQIAVRDLFVSVEGKRVVLRSRSLGKEIVPRLSAAHTFGGPGNLGLYTLLGAMQSQDGDPVAWSWGALESAPFLPRVRCGRIVLSRARWLLSREDIASFATRGSIDEQRTHALKAATALRTRLSLPRRVLLVDGDHELTVDLANVLSVDSFAQLIKSRSSAVLHEQYPDVDELVAQGPEGRFQHELVVALVRPRRPQSAATVRIEHPHRSLAPAASECLYAKLYTGTGTADSVLLSAIAPLAREAMASGIASRWFFVRYADPDPHLRVRFFGDTNALLPELARQAQALLDDGRAWRFVLDTYEPEVERYGGPVGLALAEEWFWVDSEGALAILEQHAGDEGSDARWRLAFAGIDAILDELGLTLSARRTLALEACEALRREFHADATLLRQIGAKYRRERASLLALLERRTHDPRRREIADRLRAAERSGRLTLPITAIASSFVHMHCNRFLHAPSRAQELVILDLLARTYAAQLALLS